MKHLTKFITAPGNSSRADLADAYRYRAWALYGQGELDRAIADYDQAIRLDPKDAMFHVIRGDIWYTKQDFDKAIADYAEAIRLEPQMPNGTSREARRWGPNASWTKR